MDVGLGKRLSRCPPPRQVEPFTEVVGVLGDAQDWKRTSATPFTICTCQAYRFVRLFLIVRQSQVHCFLVRRVGCRRRAVHQLHHGLCHGCSRALFAAHLGAELGVTITAHAAVPCFRACAQWPPDLRPGRHMKSKWIGLQSFASEGREDHLCVAVAAGLSAPRAEAHPALGAGWH